MAPGCDCAELDLEELAWAAGFFDGEGSTIAVADARRPGYRQLQVTVPQCGRDGVPEVLERFQCAVLGLGVIDKPFGDSMYRWRARGFVDGQAAIALLWPLLGRVKRAQAVSALRCVVAQYRTGASPLTARRPRAPSLRLSHEIQAFKAQVRAKGDAQRCVRGHDYTGRRLRGGRLRRVCNSCERITGRAKRAAQGIASRQFKNVSRRYNS